MSEDEMYRWASQVSLMLGVALVAFEAGKTRGIYLMRDRMWRVLTESALAMRLARERIEHLEAQRGGPFR
jgi:hypothetical protein